VKRAARAVAVLACATLTAALPGCGGLLRSTAPAEQSYYLRPPAVTAVAAGSGVTLSLRVARPFADPGLDSSHILLLQPDHRMSFYAGARWPGPMPEMLGALAVQTLRASGGFASVQDSGSPFPSDYLLQITVRAFDADYSAGVAAPDVHVMLDCIVGRRDGRAVIATFLASGSASAAANHLGDVVSAFEQATGTALLSLSEQSLAAVRADAARPNQNATSPAASSSLHNQ
jgi:cholesterol transport system auxiliary component